MKYSDLAYVLAICSGLLFPFVGALVQVAMGMPSNAEVYLGFGGVPLVLVGDAWHNCLIEANTGYTVIQVPRVDNIHEEVYMYAELSSNGKLVPSKFKVGVVDPTTITGLTPGLHEIIEEEEDIELQSCCPGEENSLPQVSEKNMEKYNGEEIEYKEEGNIQLFPGVISRQKYGNAVNNLVLRLRFSDHSQRVMPSDSKYNEFFNADTKEGERCIRDDKKENLCVTPTGSIKDYYLENSYQKFYN